MWIPNGGWYRIWTCGCFLDNISLAKKLNKPLWQPSMVTGEKTGYLRSPSNGNQFIPTTMVATHSGFTLWRMLGSNQHLLLIGTWTITLLESNQYSAPRSALPIKLILHVYRHATHHRYIIQSPKDCNLGVFHVRIRLYSSAVDVYTPRCLSYFNDCGF